MTPTGRDNGLPRAARYVPLVDVDPPVADHVLELLRDAGVTAVAEPVGGEVSTTTRAVAPTDRPTERVHVDGEQVLLARAVVRQALPGIEADFLADAARRQDERDTEAAERDRRRREELGADEVDTLFADIVAGYDATGDDPVPRWSVLEDAAPEADEAPPQRPPLSSRLLRSAPREDAPDDDVEGHFVPPPPPPLPEADRVTRLAWAALIGGPALIILASLFGIGLESWLAFTALCLFVGGFATLVARMRDQPSQDDGWDDGAVL